MWPLSLGAADDGRFGRRRRRTIEPTVEAAAVATETVQQLAVGGEGVVAGIGDDLGINPGEILVIRDRVVIDDRDVAQFRDVEHVERLPSHVAFETEQVEGVLVGADVVLIGPQFGREGDSIEPVDPELATEAIEPGVVAPPAGSEDRVFDLDPDFADAGGE